MALLISHGARSDLAKGMIHERLHLAAHLPHDARGTRPRLASLVMTAPTAEPVLTGSIGQGSDLTIPQLVAEVYESAPPAERGRLLEQLLRPLGVLSLVAIADGIFAKIRLRSGWQDINVRLEDIQGVRPAHVIALVDHAQQVSVETVDGLVQPLTSSSILSGSAAAVLLVTVLLQRAASRRGDNESADGQRRALDE